jgi:NAD(P)-dependent dehydrogenase (short-subunit alcohol dehydrogenase family)
VEISFGYRKQDDLDSAVTKLSETGRVRGYLCDFSDPKNVKAWVNEAGNAMGGIDIRIGNASASCQYGECPAAGE